MTEKIRVLYVDDEQLLLDIGKKFLEQNGNITVSTAESASQAFELLKKQTIDAIISDYQMPEMDGIQFLKAVRKEYPALPFIIFTGKGSDEIAIEAFESGADYYVKKVGAPTTQFAELAHRIKLAFKRRQEAKRFRESEKLFREVFNNANDAIFMHEMNPEGPGKYILVNDVAIRWLGYTREEFMTMSPHDLVPEPVMQGIVPETIKMLTGHGHATFEAVHKRKDGSTFPVEVSTRIFTFNNRQVALSIVRDITKRKRAEETLRETTEYLRNLIDFASAPIIVWDPDFRITRFNHAFEHLTGRTEQKVIGQPLDILFPKESTDASLALIKKTLAGERWESVEIPILASDGVIRTVLWNSANILTAEAELISTIAQGVDITERKASEQALTMSQIQLAEAMDLANLVNWEFDVASGIFTFNDRFYVLYGTTAEREGGYQMPTEVYTREFVPPDEVGVVVDAVQKAITATDPNYTTQIEHRIIRRDGEIRHIIVRFGITKDADGRTVKTHGANQDITELKRAADMIALANRKLTLMNDVTYQYIQNKVTGLRGYAELSKDAKTDAERLSFIEKEDHILADIHQLIKNTRDYQEIGLIQSRWIPVEQSIRIAVSLVSPKPDISIEPALHGLELYSGPLIEKIFSNLIDNAVKHGKTTTRITFSCEETTDGLILICEDDGVGISPNVKARLFDRSAGENIRFGLFFVREYLVLSGMTITENGSPGKGARFEITVPKGMYRFTATGGK